MGNSDFKFSQKYKSCFRFVVCSKCPKLDSMLKHSTSVIAQICKDYCNAICTYRLRNSMSFYYILSEADVFYGNRDITCEVMTFVRYLCFFFTFTHFSLNYVIFMPQEGRKKQIIKRLAKERKEEINA
jgi:hypothetical protein